MEIQQTGLVRTKMGSKDLKRKCLFEQLRFVVDCGSHLTPSINILQSTLLFRLQSFEKSSDVTSVSDGDVLLLFDLYNTRISPVQRSQQLKVMFS